MTKKQYRAILRAMKLAARVGFDPYNSAATQARFYWE